MHISFHPACYWNLSLVVFIHDNNRVYNEMVQQYKYNAVFGMYSYSILTLNTIPDVGVLFRLGNGPNMVRRQTDTIAKEYSSVTPFLAISIPLLI